MSEHSFEKHYFEILDISIGLAIYINIPLSFNLDQTESFS